MHQSFRIRSWGACLIGVTILIGCVPGCQTKAQTGAAAGAGVGALMGQAIGRNTKGTLIGTAVGAGAGYMIGNEMDKGEAKKEQRRREQAKEKAETTPPAAAASPGTQAAPSYLPPAWPSSTEQMKPFADTSWRVVSMSPAPRDKFTTMTVHFQPNGLVVSTIVYPDGRVTADSEQYRVVANTLIINDIGYLTNSTWTLEGSRLTLVNQNFSTTLERVGDGD